VDRRKFITGYDILDVIDPLEPISTRIARFSTWGDGWMDFLPSINATTIFGQGFGDLLLPKDATSMCKHWKSVPLQKDYMCVSVSTMKMLHEKRLQRFESPSKTGQLTSNLLWKSECQPFDNCPCTLGNSIGEPEHLDPRQLLVSSKQNWKAPLKTKASACVDLGLLHDTGAVVFANSGIFNRKINNKPEEEVENATTLLSPMESSASQSVGSTSITASDSTQTTQATATSNTTDTTTTMDASSATTPSTSAPDTTSSTDGADVNTTQSNPNGKKRDKGKGKMRWVKDIFR
jgi:hypothetical protein